MNYRHAFHAGNFADVMKHVLLARVVAHLRVKPAAFRVIDSHAGTGLYDLASSEAERTGEWRDGIGRLTTPFADPVEALLAPYREAVAAVRLRHGSHAYPGSPVLLRELLRPQDRAILIEKHPADGNLLKARFNTVSNLKVLIEDGWTTLGGLVPPRERRGLVFVDPPYEEPGELDRAGLRLAALSRKWADGIYMLWYPAKDDRAVERFFADVQDATRQEAVRLELTVDPPGETSRLYGGGLYVINPPWRLAEEAAVILPALAERLGRHGRGAHRVERRGRRP